MPRRREVAQGEIPLENVWEGKKNQRESTRGTRGVQEERRQRRAAPRGRKGVNLNARGRVYTISRKSTLSLRWGQGGESQRGTASHRRGKEKGQRTWQDGVAEISFVMRCGRKKSKEMRRKWSSERKGGEGRRP